MTIRAPKKSETIEIRLPFETKTAFMARCRTGGRTASDALRSFIEAEVSGGKIRTGTRAAVPIGLWQALVAACAGLAIGAIAAPSLAQSGHAQAIPSKVVFDRMDRNHDGVVTLTEFQTD